MPKKSKTSRNHTHQYVRVDLGKDEEYIVYRCAREDCTHYIPEFMALGKKSLCNECGNEFNLDKYSIQGRRVKPKCPDCRKKDKPNEFEALFNG